MATFGTTNPGADILAGYQKATQLSPISDAKKKQVLSDYGIAAGWSKGKTDTAVSMAAAAKVVAKFKAAQAKLKPKPTPVKAAPVPAATVASTLKQYKLPSTSKPPSYALTSTAALIAWAKRAVAYMNRPR